MSYSLTDIEFLSAWHGGIGSDIERSPLTGEIAESASVTLFFMDSKIDMLDISTFGDEVWPKKEIPVSFKFLPD